MFSEEVNDGAVVCGTCASRFPVVYTKSKSSERQGVMPGIPSNPIGGGGGGIPVLLADPVIHEKILTEARAVNPEWYITEQPLEAVSPWRHHLRKRREYVQRILRQRLRARNQERFSALLDLGCGDGNNSIWLKEFTENLYASDYNMVRLARAKVFIPESTVFLADVLRYPAADSSFDVIFFNHVLEHIPDDRGALREVWRILKPDGLLVLGVPNEGAWWWQMAYKRNPQSLQTTDHRHFYTAASVCALLREAGFVCNTVTHMGWGPPDWTWDMKLRKYKILDDLFDVFGRLFLPRQASSLYVLAVKGGSAN
jgi:SAM-dependent methyltransferase